MASQLFYLGFLFTITLLCICAQGTSDPENSEADIGLAPVPGPHQIIVQPKAKPVLLNCSLNVTDKNLLPLRYKWLKDGEQIDKIRPKLKIEVQKNGSLLLQPRKNRSRNRRLDGVYDCLVTTANNTAVIARRVEVVVASITKKNSSGPSSVEAYRGGVARFECSIWAEPIGSYIWHRNETQLPQDDQRFTSLPSGVLQISDIDPSDAGMYWCQATTYLLTFQEQAPNFGWKTGKHTELKLRADSPERPPTILAYPKNVSVLIGHTAEFECFADGNPMPSVMWKKKDSDTVFGPQNLYRHGNLRLLRVKPEDAGVYVCIISSRSRTLTANASLTVLEPPKVEQGLDAYSHPVGKNMPLQCRFSGNPAPNISWYHNGVPLNELDMAFEKKNDIKNGETLYLYTIEKRSAGFYQCIAENPVGQAMTVGMLKVISKSGAPFAPRNVKCTATSSTSILVTWDHLPNETIPYVVSYKIVGDLKPPVQELCRVRSNETKQQCEIKNQMPFTNYSVRVQAYNSKGGSDITDKVYVQTLEDVPVNVPVLSVSSPEPHSMLVYWTPLTRDQSRGRVIAYKVYYRSPALKEETSKEVPANQTSFLITGVEPEQLYEVLVVASTSAGYTKRDKWPWTQYRTPPRGALIPLRLDAKYINSTSVLLEWQASASPSMTTTEDAVTGYSLELHSLSRLEEHPKKFILASVEHSLTVAELDSQQLYEVTLIASTQQGSSSSVTINFTLTELQVPPVPRDFCTVSVHADTVTLTWTAVPGSSVTYEVCYRKELDKSDELCETSMEMPMTVSGLESFARYEFNVKALMNGTKGRTSKGLIVKTVEGRPSPPLNLTVDVRKNSVLLRWLPPAQPNGIITYYSIMYSKDTVQENDSAWKRITKEGTETSAQVDDLESGRYLFKLAAGNKAGLGTHTDVVTAILECKSHVGIPCSLVTETTKDNVVVTGTPSSVSTGITNIQIGMIAGSLIGLMCLVLIVLVVIWHKRHRCPSREGDSNTSHSPIYHGNGHISPLPGRTNLHVPGNGHVHFVGNTPGGYKHELINMHESAPMLKQIPENEHSDSKGGPDIVTPNGFRPNGVMKGHHRNVRPAFNSNSSEELNSSHNSEELHGLIAAMLASANDSDMLRKNGGQKILMSSLDDIDRGDEGLGDHSSQDSGTECRHAGMPDARNGIQTEDNSLVGSARSSLRRCQQGWERGREVDEIGGVFIDRSTGAVIGEVPATVKSLEKMGVNSKREIEGSCEEVLAMDRDSGHGSEAKSQFELINCAENDTKTSPDMNFVSPPSAMSSNAHAEEALIDSLPPAPPPPPSSLLISSTAAPQPLSSTPLSQQLSCSSSRNLSSGGRSHHSQHRQHQRGVSLQTSPNDLPPPPPTPPLSSATLPPFQGSLAAVNAAAATAELNHRSSSSIEEGGQQLSDDSGSILSRQSEGTTAVVFSQSPPLPKPPHIV